jgi:hypothetical protein
VLFLCFDARKSHFANPHCNYSWKYIFGKAGGQQQQQQPAWSKFIQLSSASSNFHPKVRATAVNVERKASGAARIRSFCIPLKVGQEEEGKEKGINRGISWIGELVGNTYSYTTDEKGEKEGRSAFFHLVGVNE